MNEYAATEHSSHSMQDNGANNTRATKSPVDTRAKRARDRFQHEKKMVTQKCKTLITLRIHIGASKFQFRATWKGSNGKPCRDNRKVKGIEISVEY